MFTHLHVHSDFSLKDGVGKEDERAQRAVDLGQTALALTDHGSLAGVLYHAEACHEVGIKPIVGIEAYFRPNIQTDRKNKNTYGYYHLLLLAKNQEGFKNLMRLSSLSYTEDYHYQKPCVDWEAIRKYSEGVIASSSCLSGLIPEQIIKGNYEEAKKLLRVFQDIYGDNFYLETQPHDIDEQRLVNNVAIEMAAEYDVPIVAAVDAHYPFKDWNDTQDIRVMIGTGSSLKKRLEDEEAGKDYMKFGGDTFWLMSEEELHQTFVEHHSDINDDKILEMISNSGTIADMCDDFYYDKSPKIPKATKDENEAEQVIREWCEEGLQRIGKDGDPIYLDRVEHEIEVMKNLKVLDYFVIVGDMVRWAKDQGIRVGPGRGSAPGSLVNYLIKITAIDPIGHKLLFERFLNEFRTELPDIDIDFQDDRQHEVIEYLTEKYGPDYVIAVSAFQSFALKGAIQDVCRVLDIPYMIAKKATDDIPAKTFGDDIESIENKIPSVKRLFDEYPEVKKHAGRLFGNMKGLSKHAAAVIVTDRPASELIPTMQSKDGSVVTQWSERANAQLISPYGFLKIDCLSTDGLTVQQKTIDLIKERHNIVIDFEDPKQFEVIYDPYASDPEVVKLFTQGANLGIFQFGSKGIVGLLKAIKPENLSHIIAANALYRPGTLDNAVAFDYAKRKNSRTNWKIPHEIVEEFIDETYGLMIYQEQVMQIYRALAKDATPAEASVFLKVIAKGIARDLIGKQRLEKYQDKFTDGCIENGLTSKTYMLLWDQMLQMSTYSFNKSHSAGYGLQGYQDAYLKHYFPLEFYASLLTVELDQTTEIIRESKGKGIKILPPDINTSEIGFTIDGNNIRFGLLGIKSVGPSALDEIDRLRPFESFEDMLTRCKRSVINKTKKKALLFSGALDRFGGRRSWILDEEAMEKIFTPMSEGEISILEREYIGFTVSLSSDLEIYKDVLDERINKDLDNTDDGEETMVGGEVIDVKVIKTKAGDSMAFVTLDYFNNDYALTLFPEGYSKYNHMLGNGNAILAIGDWDKERQSITVKNMCTAEQLAMELNK